MTTASRRAGDRLRDRLRHLLAVLNGPQHDRWVAIFMVIVIAHWLEHVFQAVQIYVLGWPRPAARGMLGMIWPWLVSSEWLHYAYALLMLIFLAALRPGFGRRARQWWSLALGIQFWHHFEHLLLLLQAQTGVFLFGAKAPTSVLQLFVPRVELHLFYNAIVFAPMVVAVVLHRRGSDRESVACGCARPERAAA